MTTAHSNVTRAIWFYPASYSTSDDQKLSIDCTEYVQRILINKVWERKFDYGSVAGLDSLTPDSALRCLISISPFEEPLTITSPEAIRFVEEICREPIVTAHFDDARLTACRNLIAIEFEFSFPFLGLAADGQMTGNFIDAFRQLYSLQLEVGALFRSAIHLIYKSPHILGWHKNDDARGGLCFVKSGDGQYVGTPKTDIFTCPGAICDKTHLPQILDELSEVWHLSLWPIHRFLRALDSQDLETEDMLDLLFALEGLFDEKASPETIRLTTTLLIAGDLATAQSINEYLKVAFKIRNQIVHGSKYYGDSDKIKVRGKDILVQELFWEIRDDVARMIRLALRKLRATSGVTNLRLSSNDVIEKYYEPQSSSPVLGDSAPTQPPLDQAP